MTVRLKLALTVMATGLVTALAVIVAVIYAFERFEHETTFARADAFLERVATNYDDLLDMQQQKPAEFRQWLRGLVFYEPDTQLYLLDGAGVVLATSGDAQLAPGFRVALGPVKAAVAIAAGNDGSRYVMGDDPERMDADAVIAARPVRRATIRPDSAAPSGYLYLVVHRAELPANHRSVLRKSLALPALLLIVGICAATSLFAALIIAAVTRPLRRLTDAVATLSAHGLEDGLGGNAPALLPPPRRDEFGQLTAAFAMMLETLRKHWAALRRLDHFRREGVSNLSHDLRSPLTATVACLETLERRWAEPAGGPAAIGDDERRLVAMALRNTRNAARLVQSLGDLARLDEPAYALRRETVDAAELLDDIRARFAERAAQRGVTLRLERRDDEVAAAALDIELFERAIANLIDNALKFCPAGSTLSLAAHAADGWLRVSVTDDGPGIAAADLPHLFDRFYQSRQSVAPATGEGGKGLGLAIVKRIAELHGGHVEVRSEAGRGAQVLLSLPQQPVAIVAQGPAVEAG
jgi:signal transduction histidine kinase